MWQVKLISGIVDGLIYARKGRKAVKPVLTIAR